MPYGLPIFGFIVFGFILYFIWDRLLEINFSDYNISNISLGSIFIALILMPLNWFLESKKWGILLDKIQDLSMAEKYKSVFFGQAFGFVTPNRLGDYGGRLIYIKKEYRFKALQATFIASIYQTTITFCIGIPALFYWISNNMILNQKFNLIAWLVIIVLFSFLILLTFRLKRSLLFLLKFKIFNKYTDEIQWFIQLPKNLLVKVLSLSFIRYIVFLIQYILVVYSFESNFSLIHVIAVIASLYLLTTLIPTGFISDLLVRGAAGILLFLPLIDSEETILLISLIIWFINIALAAIVGSLLLLKHKNFKS